MCYMRQEGRGVRGMDTKICILKHILGYSSVLVKSINRTVHNVSKFQKVQKTKGKAMDYMQTCKPVLYLHLRTNKQWSI